MRCGNCGDRHEAVADVRACYEHSGKRTVTPQQEARPAADAAKVPERKNAPEVPAGRYAILAPDQTGSEVLKFFWVDKPTEGRWKGYTFVKEQAGPQTFAVRDRERRERILAKIAEDPRKAMLTYGRELGVCGMCGLPLTNEESRAYGVGPICRVKARF